jgi:Zn-finger nucleic acid-binding protein
MDHPYRSGPRIACCPRCSKDLEADGIEGRFACVAGCGHWYPDSFPDETVGLAPKQRLQASPSGAAWPWGPAACPICRRDMNVAFRADHRCDYCPAHGTWFDAGEH